MVALQSIWSNGMVFAVVGSAVVSVLLMVVCFIAGLCPCEKSQETTFEPVAPSRPVDSIDMTWMRAA